MFYRQVRCVCWLPLLCVLGSDIRLEGAERRLSGRDIFRQQCTKCHGRNGEGVKGKYADALHGDWPLDRLTRYIDKKMPEDAPEKCVGVDAEAVARFIYDAFYSRDAWLRNHPPRIELVRLTNRQYVNTVADLIKSFTGNAAAIGSERGLRGSYYNSRDFNRNKKVFDRDDREVSFDFGEGSPFAPGSPESQGVETNGFSMQWRGSIIADESGDHEFIVKTPNGARLWVNDEETPLIDAWVASGDLREHKAALRLIGGRAYPLRLDYFKFKDKAASMSLRWKPPHGADQVISARSLSPARVTPTFVVTTPFPPDDSSVGYERGVSVSKAWDEATTHAAIEVANYVVKNLDHLLESSRRREEADAVSETSGKVRLLTAAATNRVAKAEAFCSDFVATAFRRPLTPDQKRLFVTSQFKRGGKPGDAVKRVVLLTLKSPRFLYLGLENTKPDDFDVAARLSFSLWDSLPDRELLKLAAQGELHTREQVIQQAHRMLADPRTHAKMLYFLQHWLQMNRVEDLSKDAQVYPGFTPEIIADLRTSLNLFLEDTVWNGRSDYRQLLLADDLFLNNRLAQFYGMSTNIVAPSLPSTPLSAGAIGEGEGLEGGEGHKMTDDFVKVNFDSKLRCGVVTHPYLLAEFSYQKSTSPIHRGVFLTRNIVGRALKPPPMAQVFKDSDFAPDLTMREKVAELTRSQACQTCHSVINPLGFSLEHYDAVGRFRSGENGKPINAVSDYTTDEGATIRLTGARDVAQFAASSEQAQNGFIEQLFNQVVKQPMLAYGHDVMGQLRQSFVASEFHMQKLLVDIATISALHGVEGASQAKSRK